MPDPTAAARGARYRRRKHVEDIARFAGWEPMDALVFTKDGKHRLVSLDGVMIPLVPEDHAPVEAKEPPHERGVYAPKDIPAEWFGKWRGAIIQAAPTKDATIDAVEKITSLDGKALKHLVAMIRALPDSPDWYLSIPEPEATS